MYSNQFQPDQLRPPAPPPPIMHQLVDNVSGPLYHQQQVTIYPPAPTANTYNSPLASLPTMNGMRETTSSHQNDGYAHHASQPQLPAEPTPSTTSTPTTPMTIPQLAQFAATMTYFLWHVRTSSVMALHSASSQADLTSATANLSVSNQSGTTTTSPLQQQQTNPAFQRFCQQILTSTQVSESVVLLALKYIAKLLQTNPNIQGAQGSEYRLFIVALLLANKFHDDNTFTNKTWADISGMKLHELDIMELEFLNVLDFRLFIGKEEFDHWKTGLFSFMLQVQNATAMQEQQQLMNATLQSMGLCLPPQPPQDVPAAHQHPYPSYLFSTTAQPDLLQIQLLNTPVTRVPLRIPSYPVYMPIQSNSASSSIHSTPTSATSAAAASHVPTSYVPPSTTPIKGALYPPPQTYHQHQQQHLPPLSNSNPEAYASASQIQQPQQQQQQQQQNHYAYPTSLGISSSRPLPRNASTPSLSAWAHQSTRSTTPMDQTQQHHHHHHPHPHHHHHHHHQRAYRPYQRPVTTNNSSDHQQPLVDYYAWKSLTQGNHGQLDRIPSPMKANDRPSYSFSTHRRRSYSNPFPQQNQQMLKPYAFPRQQVAPHDSNHYQDYQQIGADLSRPLHDQQQQQQQYHLNGAHHSN